VGSSGFDIKGAHVFTYTMTSPNRNPSNSSKELNNTNKSEQVAMSTGGDESLPQYYDAEPSKQPPQYHKPSTPNAKRKSTQQQPEFAGASAASVAAILASPSLDTNERKEKKPWRERWKDFKERWNADDKSGYQVDYGSSANWNYFGARLDGRQTRGRSVRK
jgi:hypothetical protein